MLITFFTTINKNCASCIADIKIEKKEKFYAFVWNSFWEILNSIVNWIPRGSSDFFNIRLTILDLNDLELYG